MDKIEIAAIFAEMADIMEILEEDAFRILSYRKAARCLEETAEDVVALAHAGQLQSLPGIGKSSAAKIDELLRTGTLGQLEELRAKVPSGVHELMKVQGMGPKTAAKLWRELGIAGLADLEHALDANPERLEALPGLGPKKIAAMRESIGFAKSISRFRIDEALPVAQMLRDKLAAAPGAGRCEYAGSTRRWRETVADVDVVCEAAEADAPGIIEAFVSTPAASHILARGTTKASILAHGPGTQNAVHRVGGPRLQADLRVVPPASFGAALQYFTGSKDHNVALRGLAIKHKLKLNEYGLFDQAGRAVAGANEEEVYAALHLPWIPPELREGHGEIQAALEGRLPDLLEPGDIRGDLHMHTTASDGLASLDDMIETCRQLGYQYLAITEHSQKQVQAHGLDEGRLAEHVALIRRTQRKYSDIHVLAGIEVDIFKDGTLDFSDDVLAGLDFVLASPHAALTQKGQEATRRLIRAVENPVVHAIGHPTGRLINRRQGMEIDIVKLAQAAAANGVALELNADPARLDLRDTHVRAAVEAGAKIVISTDTHTAGAAGSLALMRFGVHTARRGWATRDDVINAWEWDRLQKWLKK